MGQIGETGIKVSSLCLGGNVFGWTADEATSFAILDAFSDAGMNFVDTADTYSTWKPGNKGGESETIIGEWMKQRGNRNRMVIATKGGKEMGPGKKGLSAKYITGAVEDSLRRLQTDYIDLYQSHEQDPDTPIEETLRAYTKLIDEGKIRAIGASNYQPEQLEESLQVSRELGLARYNSLQPHYNLLERAAYETALEPFCLAHHLSVLPYWSLASGFLTGKYRSQADLGKSVRGKAARKYLNDRGLRVLSALDEVAAAHSSTPTAVALAWLMARPSVTCAYCQRHFCCAATRACKGRRRPTHARRGQQTRLGKLLVTSFG
jgi:aryl-alcohol dehydrogenase-like predicted oxidoreductase